MKQKTQTMHWIIDAALLFGFLLAFFLDLTGLAVHQWLGVALVRWLFIIYSGTKTGF